MEVVVPVVDVVMDRVVDESEDKTEVVIVEVIDVSVVVDDRTSQPAKPINAIPARNKKIFVFIQSPALMDPLYHE